MKQKNKLAVIRALDLRIAQAEHVSFFKKIDVSFVSNQNPVVSKYLNNNRIKNTQLNLVKPYFVDPVKWVLGNTSHQSWLTFNDNDLEKTLKRVDIFQVQEPFFLYSGQVATLAKKYQKLLICAPFMCFDHLSSHVLPYSLSVKKVIDQTDFFLIRSKKVNEYLSRFKIPSRKKVLIYHGVNTKRFFPAKKKNDDVFHILFVGILHFSKGLNDLLDIFPKLLKLTNKKLELVICGAGPLHCRVEEMSKDLPIKYLGQVSNLDLPEIYRSADIFCGPSQDWRTFGKLRWEEGFGFVFAEAMASGLPIVTCDCGAICEIVGKDNIVNKQKDQNALIKSLLELINDKDKRLEIGNRNRKRAKKLFDMKNQVKLEEKEIISRLK